ncbi:MAG: 1-acyl-sn-glycerol-3-phosphate acyltransferase, partial [Chlamydiae bacterium]|nr:1-acyl-sn-glycerol-3-phosphate acyltransferase [Chlamydiota bacterium]
MGKNSKSDFLKKINEDYENGLISHKIKAIFETFFQSYRDTLAMHGISIDSHAPIFFIFLDLVKQQCKSPYSFQQYHEQIRTPFDYYEFGVEFMKPLIDRKQSSVLGLNHLNEIAKFLAQGGNVIFFSNHQTEADPQAISILLEKSHPKIAQEMIFVAGERVTSDPLAIPFSMGRNLLCIYSKKYIDHPPELKHQKQIHNKKTMQLMSYLLSQGGKTIYVAPSGGRDRRNPEGILEIAPFDSQSIEMFYLMSKKAIKPTLFYPMALGTYNLLPPPQTVQIELGEDRLAKRGG